MTVPVTAYTPAPRGASSPDVRLIAVLAAAQRQARSEGEGLIELIRAAGDATVGRQVSYYA